MIATLKTMLAQRSALSKWSLHGLNAGMTVLTLIPFAPSSLDNWRMPLIWGSSLLLLASAAGMAEAYRRAKQV